MNGSLILIVVISFSIAAFVRFFLNYIRKITFKIAQTEVILQVAKNGLRLTTVNGNNLFLQNQTIKETKEVIEKNYTIVNHYFAKRALGKIDSAEIELVSLKIVFGYLRMYNKWRIMDIKEKNRDLTFIDKDFNNQKTFDIIVRYFKNKYPNGYSKICEILLDMSPDKFRDYEKERLAFINMW
jgi:hypothetical protein